MASRIERRKPISKTAVVIALMFGAGVAVSLLFGGVPTWQNHGNEAGPGIVWRADDPKMYLWLTIGYAVIASTSLFISLFRLPAVSITHIRLLILAVFLLLFWQLISGLMVQSNNEKAQAAWNRIEQLGGHGVWESDMVVVSLANTGVTDEDLSLFADFPHVQILDLSNTQVTDGALKHLDHLDSLESLVLVGTAVSPSSIEQFRTAHPSVEVKTEPMPKDAINPFTGEPFATEGG